MISIGDVLEPRPWLRCADPFPHVVACGVFRPRFYELLEEQIRGLLGLGLSEVPGVGRFARNLPGYDAYATGLGHVGEEPTSLFLTAAWRDLLARLWGIGPTPYVMLGAHHHTPGSASGFIHNDFNPVWFPRAEGQQIRTPDNSLCAYRDGSGALPPERKVKVVRGATMILYLANDPWTPGDGGETALYRNGHDQLDRPVRRVPPVNNSLVSFECTPASFHTFLSNRRIARTSLIMWIHRPFEEATGLYGEERLEHWRD